MCQRCEKFMNNHISHEVAMWLSDEYKKKKLHLKATMQVENEQKN